MLLRAKFPLPARPGPCLTIDGCGSASIRSRDRVVLVIVAAGAADRQAEHGGADGGQLVVEFVVAVLLDFGLGDLRAVNAGREETGGLHRLMIVGLVFVAGDLPADERVI